MIENVGKKTASGQESEKLNLHPLLSEALVNLSQEERDYLKDRNFEQTCGRELEILSTNLYLLEGPEGKNRMEILRNWLESENLIPQDSDNQTVLLYLIKKTIQETIELDKRYFKNNGEYDPYPGSELRLAGIQLARQGYFAFLNRHLLPDNVLIKELDERGYQESWETLIPVFTDLSKTLKMLTDKNFPSDRVTLGGQNLYQPIHTNELMEIFRKLNQPEIEFPERIRSLTIFLSYLPTNKEFWEEFAEFLKKTQIAEIYLDISEIPNEQILKEAEKFVEDLSDKGINLSVTGMHRKRGVGK